MNSPKTDKVSKDRKINLFALNVFRKKPPKTKNKTWLKNCIPVTCILGANKKSPVQRAKAPKNNFPNKSRRSRSFLNKNQRDKLTNVAK
jgi:hypothetical protein